MEDFVVAMLTAHLITGATWTGSSKGEIQSIQCQMQQDGWTFDDVVLNLHQDGVDWKCACSIKSYPVLGQQGPSTELAQALWSQWDDKAGAGFHQELDTMAIIAAQHTPEVREAWFGLCDAARAMLPETLAQRCVSGAEPSPIRRAAFRNLASGANRADTGETARLLRQIRLVEHDFHHSESQSATTGTLICQQALAENERGRASELWEALVAFCAEVRRKGGVITLPKLLNALSKRFSLKQHPNYAGDWTSLLSESRHRMKALPMKIGGVASIQRPELMRQLAASVEQNSQVTILGESGNGKSVLACTWAGVDKTIWLRATDLSAPGGIRALFGIRHGAAELFSNTTQLLRIVLDGLDKCFDEASFDEAASILKTVLLPDNRQRWQVAMTCCPEDWERVRGQLVRRGVKLLGSPIRAGRFSDAEFRDVCRAVPSLRGLAQRPHLQPVLRWPKALDVVATHWQPSDAETPWATESQFAKWFWQSVISQDNPASFRDKVARKLAVQLADTMSGSASLDQYSLDETVAIEELVRAGHLEIDSRRRTVRFTHDLIADWARQRELQVQHGGVSTFLANRLHSPFWHRAVRFHGLDVLEQASDATEWLSLFTKFEGESPAYDMAQNLLLEAPTFAIAQEAILERLWPTLAKDNGELLKRFLRQFLRAGTIPDESIVAIFRDESAALQLDAATRYRLPWIPFWYGIINFLFTHADEAVVLAGDEIAEICIMWLPLRGVLSTGLQETAALATKAARRLYRSREGWHSRRQKTSTAEKVCRALLAAAPIAPSEVTELALKLSGRRLPDPDDNFPKEEREWRSSLFPDPGPRVPWDEGPQRDGAAVFRHAFLDREYVAPLMQALPELAAELMFAVLLDIPYATRQRYGSPIRIDEHGFNRGHLRYECPLWFSGPFLTFLQINPAVALPAIVRLADFATDRSRELGETGRPQVDVAVTVNGTMKVWTGHQHSYLWCQGHVFCPQAVGCALLSLEKWFYTLMDAGTPLDEHLNYIVNQTKSIGLAGVLVNVGKRQPDLFLGPLRPILEAADFFYLEEVLKGLGQDYSSSSFCEDAPAIMEKWREWVQMPHRKDTLKQVTIKRFLSSTEWRSTIREIRLIWERRVESTTTKGAVPPWLPHLISQFDEQNWREVQHDSGTFIVYDAPAGLPGPTAAQREQSQRVDVLTLLPFQCRQVLMGEQESSEAQMEEWWNLLNVAESLKNREDDHDFRNVEDALCGVIAVAVVHHRAWLAADSSKEKRAEEILARVASNPPKSFWFGSDEATDFKWDNFCAWAFTTLWCERPADPYFLNAVGSLVLWGRHIVVSRIMSIAFKKRTALGAYFDRLVSHAIKYSPIRHEVQIQGHTDAKGNAALNRQFDAHVRRFVRGKTPALPASWQELLKPQKRKGTTRDCWSSGLEIGYVAEILNSINPDTSASEQERKVYLHRCHEGLKCAIARIERVMASNSVADDYNRQEYWPFKGEEKFLRFIAIIVAHHPSENNHRDLWEPLFALGCDATHWITRFISRWRLEAAGRLPVSPSFAEQWKAMLTYADESLAWNRSGRMPSWSRDIKHELLGYSVYSSDFWVAELMPAVDAVRHWHEKWAARHIWNDHDASTYIRFLMSAAAKNLRVPGLLILRQTAALDDAYFWREETVRNQIANFLRLLQEEHWPDIQYTESVRDAFMLLALKLSSLQHPLGNELLVLVGKRLNNG